MLERTANGAEAEFLVVLNDQADLTAARQLPTREAKGRAVRDAFWNKWLRERNIEHRSYYIVNLLWVKAGAEVAQALAARPEVLRVEGNPLIRNMLPEPIPDGQSPLEPGEMTTVEPGITRRFWILQELTTRR